MIDTSLDSANFYFLFAVLQGVVLAALIILSKPQKKPNVFFGVLILLFSISLLHLVLEQSVQAFNVKFPVPMDFSMAYGPLAYLHVVFINDPKRKFRSADLLHFVPSVLIDGVLFSAFFIYAGRNMDWAYANLQTIQQGALMVTAIALLQLIAYTLATYRQAYRSRTMLKDFNEVRIWVRYILLSWSVIIVFLLIAVPIALINLKHLDDNTSMLYQPFGVITGISIYALGYLYLIRYMKKVGSYAERAERVKFTDTELLERKRILLETLHTKKFYKDPSVSVADVAKQMGWPVNDLSFLINELFQANFNDWINQYRVAAFKALLLDPENKKYSLLGLSQEVGFNSKASFYRAFKKETGVTPGDYLKSEVPK